MTTIQLFFFFRILKKIMNKKIPYLLLNNLYLIINDSERKKKVRDCSIQIIVKQRFKKKKKLCTKDE